jgi:hypothetical protein
MTDTSALPVNTDSAFCWDPLGQERWRELGQAAGCSELQLRFAVAKFSGASQTAAARIAGYHGDDEALRRAGYAAARSTGVANLLELAAINAPATAAITDTEINAKLAKLIRSQDSNVSIKAMELHAKRQAALKDQKAAADDYDRGDGLFAWRIERDAISKFRNGATAHILVCGIHNLKLLHDTYFCVHKEEFGPEIWKRLYDKLNADWHKDIDRWLADPTYQLEARKQIWGEVGKKPPAPVDSQAVDWRARGLLGTREVSSAAQ